MLKLIFLLVIIILDVTNLNGYVFTRQINWKFKTKNGEPRVYKSNKSHGWHVNGHDVFNEGISHPKLKTF